MFLKARNIIEEIHDVCQGFFKDSSRCTLEEINIRAQTVTILYRGKSAAIKSSFGEIISDNDVIQRLTASEACLLGAYYGRALRTATEGRQHLKKLKNMGFLLKVKRGRYKLLYQDQRSELLGYIDQKTKHEFLEHPLTIAQNNYVISEFDPSQACYIGILAGFSFEKTLGKDKKTGTHNLSELLKKHPQLRVIK